MQVTTPQIAFPTMVTHTQSYSRTTHYTSIGYGATASTVVTLPTSFNVRIPTWIRRMHLVSQGRKRQRKPKQLGGVEVSETEHQTNEYPAKGKQKSCSTRRLGHTQRKKLLPGRNRMSYTYQRSYDVVDPAKEICKDNDDEFSRIPAQMLYNAIMGKELFQNKPTASAIVEDL